MAMHSVIAQQATGGTLGWVEIAALFIPGVSLLTSTAVAVVAWAHEAVVLVSLARGRSNPQIARDLSIARETVSSHLEHIYELGVSRRTEVALFAMRHGLFDLDLTTPE